jgi:DNA replication initiation complex subunit (GINS family)
MNYKGKIIIGDAPLQSCNFENLLEKTRIKELIEEYKKMYKDVVFVIEDWRLTFMESGSMQKQKR